MENCLTKRIINKRGCIEKVIFCIKWTNKLAAVQIFYLAFSMMTIITERLELTHRKLFNKTHHKHTWVHLGYLKRFCFFFFNNVVLSVLVIVHAATSTSSRRCWKGVRMIVWENSAITETRLILFCFRTTHSGPFLIHTPM